MIKLIISLALVFSITTSTLLITQPAKNPFEENQIKYWYANFGIIHYNKPANYQLIVLNQGFCNITQYERLEHFNTPTYVVVNGDIDGCSFPSRAMVAQNLGAAGIIFGSRQVKYAMGDVVISNDGQGKNIKINSLFIQPKSYENLKPLKNIMIKVDFPIIKRNVSEVNLFLTASQRKNYIFLRNFRQYYELIKDYIDLNVVYHTIDCKDCLQDDCILNNQCCAFDLENFQTGLGMYIIKEQFRQSNIFIHQKKQKNIDLWFEYMNRFDQQCTTNWKFSDLCSRSLRSSLNIKGDMDLTDQYHDMNEWRRLQTKMGIFSHPDISVNGVVHTETLSPFLAFNMICESLTDPPQSCFEQQLVPKQPNKIGLIVGLTIGGILLIILGICCYKKAIKKQITNDMSAKVNELVAKYATKVSQQKKKRKYKLMEKATEQI